MFALATPGIRAQRIVDSRSLRIIVLIAMPAIERVYLPIAI